MPENQPKLRIMDNPAVGETYVNQVIGASFDGANIGVTLGCRRVVPDHLKTMPESPAIHVISRLALTPAAAADLAKALSGILTAIAKGSGKSN